jgi:hypothetical protein
LVVLALLGGSSLVARPKATGKDQITNNAAPLNEGTV